MNVAEARKNFPFWILWILMFLTILSGYKSYAQTFPVPEKPRHDPDPNIGYDTDGSIYFYWDDIIATEDYHYNVYISFDGTTFRIADERRQNFYIITSTDGLTYWTKVAVANEQGAEGDLSLASNPIICDLSPPLATAFSPRNLSDNIAPNQDIQVTFSEQIKESTLDRAGAIIVRADGVLQNSAFEYNATNYILTINPTGGIKNAVDYQITLSEQITDLAGNSLDETTSWSFETAVPSQFTISNALNHPNPMGDGGTTFYYTLNLEAEEVMIQIYSYNGKLIRTLEGAVDQGNQEVYWNGLDVFGDELPNGVYFYRVTAASGNNQGTMKTTRRRRLMALR